MSAQSEALEAKRTVISQIAKDTVKSPDMPLDKYAGEALFLFKWCRADKPALEARGLDWSLVEDIPTRILAMEEAEALWSNVRFGREEAMNQWMLESPAGYARRDELLHEFRYAYYNYPELQTRVAAVAEGSGDADMIQDLNTLAVIGRENPAPLKTTNFDVKLLTEAAETSHRLGSLRADASVDKTSYRDSKLLRDQAYTHLKEAVDEVRRCGQFVFWKNDDRLRGYASEYKRRNRRNAKDDPQPPADLEIETASKPTA